MEIGGTPAVVAVGLGVLFSHITALDRSCESILKEFMGVGLPVRNKSRIAGLGRLLKSTGNL